MKIQTLFDEFLDGNTMVSLNGSPVYSQRAAVFKSFLEYDVTGLRPLLRGRTAIIDITTKQSIDPEELKLNLL